MHGKCRADVHSVTAQVKDRKRGPNWQDKFLVGSYGFADSHNMSHTVSILLKMDHSFRSFQDIIINLSQKKTLQFLYMTLTTLD